MQKTKHVLKSKAVIASLLGLLVSLGQVWGYVSSEDFTHVMNALEASWPHLVTIATALGAIYGRIVAEEKLTLK